LFTGRKIFPTLVVVKRPVLHIIFWFVYLVQDTFLHFTWMASTVSKEVSDAEQFRMATITALCLLIPKLFLVYYIIGRGLKKFLEEKANRMAVLAEFGFVLLVSIVSFRVLFHFVVYPKIYRLETTLNLFHARSVLISILEMGYITGIAITLKLLRQQIASREKERNLVKEKLQTELKFLKNQTNPHFLFNTLNNIYALARKKSDKTPEMVMKLSELLSFVLYESGRERISLQEDIRILEDYIDLQKIRYNGRLSLSFQKNIANADGLIAPLVLLPLIENAFKYGASENRFNSYINVSIHEKAGWLKYEVENSVEKKEEKKEKECIGLNNTRRQLELMYKEYEMAIDHNEDFFKVMLTINLNSYGKI